MVLHIYLVHLLNSFHNGLLNTIQESLKILLPTKSRMCQWIIKINSFKTKVCVGETMSQPGTDYIKHYSP
jgi:hypothetical protein